MVWFRSSNSATAEKDASLTNTDSVSTGSPAELEANAKDADRWTKVGVTARSFRRGEGELSYQLKARHLHMIAIGGSIGAGLFVGSGSALFKGGPGSLESGFFIIGIMIFCVVHALGELSTVFPVSGGFYTYSARFIDPSWGFAMGWNYTLQWTIVIPLEITVASLTCQYWGTQINPGVWITTFWVALILISIFGVLGYAEEEFWASCLKLSAVSMFLVLGVVLVCGGGPANGKYNEYWGARYFYDPGAFKNGIKGFCSVFVTAAFAFSGTELVGLAAAESRNPAKALPGAIKQVFWRITLFYILALLFIGLLVSSEDPRLLGSGALMDVAASPFVIVAKDAGIIGLDSFINAVILVSVISIGLSGVYGGSRTLTALAQQGYAPKCFSYIDRAGRPLFSTIAILASGPIAYISLTSSGAVVFEWLQALSGLAALFTWGSICLAHIRFRKAWAYHGRTLDDIPFKAAFGVYGSYLGLGLIAVVFVAQFYTALYPPSGASPEADTFFKAYLALPVLLIFYIVGYLWKGKGWLNIKDIDVEGGMRDHDWASIRETNRKRSLQPIWKKVLSMVF